MKRKFNKTLSLGFIISLLIGQIVAAESVNIHEPLATNQVETFISNQENMKTNKDSDYSLPTECMEKVGEEERTNIDKQALDEESDFSEEECEKILEKENDDGEKTEFESELDNSQNELTHYDEDERQTEHQNLEELDLEVAPQKETSEETEKGVKQDEMIEFVKEEENHSKGAKESEFIRLATDLISNKGQNLIEENSRKAAPVNDSNREQSIDGIVIDHTKSPILTPNLPYQSSIQPQGLADVRLLRNTRLSANYAEPKDPKNKKITLNYSGTGLANLGLLKSMFIIFRVPPEIFQRLPNAKTLEIHYDVPLIDLLGLGIRDRGTIKKEDLLFDYENNQIYAEYRTLLSLSLAGKESYFQLDIELETLPLPQNGEYYSFYAEATNQLVELTVNDDTISTATLAAPRLEFAHVPEKITFETTKIGTHPVTVPRKNPNDSLVVRDTRGEGSEWRVQASISKPLTLIGNSNHTLPEALIYIDENNNKHILSEEAVNIYQGVTGDSEETVIWSTDTGPFLELNSFNGVYAGEYETAITWTLVDAP